MKANNTANTIIKRENPYKNADIKSHRSGKHPGKIVAWRSWDESTFLRRDKERYK